MNAGNESLQYRGRALIAGGGWKRARCWVNGGSICMTDEPDNPCISYEPADHPQMVADFARIESGDEQAAVDFAGRWGPLGSVLIGAPDALPIESCSDELPWIYAHASRVRWCLEIAHQLYFGLEADLARTIRSFCQATGGRAGQYARASQVSIRIAVGDRDLVHQVEVAGFDQWADLARAVFQALINPVIEDIHPRLDVSTVGADDDRLVVRYWYDALIQVIYLHLANIVADKEGIDCCEYCGNFFLPSRKGQRYCPPQEMESESRCGRSARYEKGKAGAIKPSKD